MSVKEINNIKGINNQPCLGPCYPKGTIVLHPVYLFPITDNEKPFCPTFQWNNNNNNNEKKHHDTCEKTAVNNKTNKDIELLYAIPNFGFDCAYFLKNYYDIYSFEGALDWLNENNSIYTKLRIMDCAFKIYDHVINDQLVDFYIEVIKKVWIHDIYDSVYNYITVDNNIYFKKNKSNLDKKTNKIEKINFFLEKFNNKSFVYNMLNSFPKNNSDLKKYYIDYCIKKIESIISKK